MRITPLDVRKQEFRRVVRGLDPEEVYAFMATIADEYEAVLTDNKQLREKVLDLDDKVGEYRNMEKTLRDTLLTAERVMAEARDNARKESELILRDSRLKADQHTASIAARVEALRTQLRELRAHRDAFLVRLRTLAESQIQLVENYQQDFEADDRRVLEVAEKERATEQTSAAPGERPQPPSPPPTQATPAPPGASPTLSTSDQWREYALDSGAGGAPRPSGIANPVRSSGPPPTPGKPSSDPATTQVPPATPPAPIETGVDGMTPSETGSPRVDRSPNAERAGGMEDLADVVAAVTSAARDRALEKEGTRPGLSGQPSQSVAPSPGPDQAVSPPVGSPGSVAGTSGKPFDGEKDDEAAPSKSMPWSPHASTASGAGSREESESASGWSLSRFTKGLTRF